MRERQLGDADEEAWDECSASDTAAWEPTTGDGLAAAAALRLPHSL